MIAQVNVNFWAVLVAAIASMVVGFIWYGPLFGKSWMKLMNIDMNKTKDKKKGMGKMYFITFIASLITGYVLAHIISYTQSTTVSDAALAAFWNWLGFMLPLLIGSILWEGKPAKLFFINAVYWLVNLLVMASILVAWP